MPCTTPHAPAVNSPQPHIFARAGGRTVARSGGLAAWFSLAILVAPAASAQYPDAQVLPRGVFRISFEPSYRNFDMRFDLDGNTEPLGTDFTSDSAGALMMPGLVPTEDAIRTITGNPAYRMVAGAFTTTLDGDVRRFPLNLRLGLSSRLTLTASIPMLTTRSQVAFSVDSTEGNVGLNQASTAGGLAQIQMLQMDLTGAVATVDAQIAAGAFGCPSSASCTQARDAVATARLLGAQLGSLTGIDQQNTASDGVPPFAPLMSSAEGQSILIAIQNVSSELAAFGAMGITGTLPLPRQRLSAKDVQSILTDSAFTYRAMPLEFARLRNKLGDLEVGLQYGMVQRPALRTLLSATVRLPTGTRDLPDHFVDIGIGDRQTDVVGELQATWSPGSVVALAVSGRYTLQLADRLTRRVTPHTRPIVDAATQREVNRNLGDLIEIGIHPSVRLSEAFTVYASAHYFHRTADAYTEIGVTPAGQPSADVLSTDTEMKALSFGGGIHYYNTRARHGRALPIAAGIDYRTTFQGSGGLTPKSSYLYFYLRLFYQVFGGDKERDGG